MALSIMFGRHFPKLFGFTEVDIQRLYPCKEKLVVESIKETGYMHIQATKPDTVGKNQSPDSSYHYYKLSSGQKFTVCMSV